MKSLLPVLAVVLWPLGLGASTVLFSHQGSLNPSTEGWGRSAPGTIVGEAFDDGGRDVWRVYDPGLASGGTSLTYSSTLNAALTSSVMEAGWTLSSTLSVPQDDPTESIAWATGSNTWVGFIINESPTNRRLWALMFGRAANGDTLVSAYGVSGTLSLAPGYHDYDLTYDPVTALVTIKINGDVWKTYSGGSIAGNGANQVYWGDNSGQTVVQPARSAYYESVQFSTAAPEPGRLVMLGLGGICATTRRKRR